MHSSNNGVPAQIVTVVLADMDGVPAQIVTVVLADMDVARVKTCQSGPSNPPVLIS